MEEGPYQKPTEEEMKKIGQAFTAYFEKLSQNICPQCDQPIAEREQRGRCVYALPCGHRLYQGSLKRHE